MSKDVQGDFADDTVLDAPEVPTLAERTDVGVPMMSVSDSPTLPSDILTTQPDRAPVHRIDTVPDGPIEVHLSKLAFTTIPGEDVTGEDVTGEDVTDAAPSPTQTSAVRFVEIVDPAIEGSTTAPVSLARRIPSRWITGAILGTAFVVIVWILSS